MPVFIVQSTQFWNQLRSPGLYLLSMIFDVFLEMRAPCLTTALKMRFDKLNSIMVSDVLLQLCRLKSIMAGTSYLLNEYAAVQQEFLFVLALWTETGESGTWISYFWQKTFVSQRYEICNTQLANCTYSDGTYTVHPYSLVSVVMCDCNIKGH